MRAAMQKRGIAPGRSPRDSRSWSAVLIAGFLVAATASSCAKPTDPLAAPDIAYGEDVCEQCGMIISEARFAAASIVEVDGNTAPRRFDEVGDMLAYHRTNSDIPVRRWYVHDYDTEAWLDAEAAYFVVANEIRGPMGSKIAAFSTHERASEFASAVAGEVSSFSVLRASPSAIPGS